MKRLPTLNAPTEDRLLAGWHAVHQAGAIPSSSKLGPRGCDPDVCCVCLLCTSEVGCRSCGVLGQDARVGSCPVCLLCCVSREKKKKSKEEGAAEEGAEAADAAADNGSGADEQEDEDSDDGVSDDDARVLRLLVLIRVFLAHHGASWEL